MKQWIFAGLFLAGLPLRGAAPMTDLIDIPTPEVVDHYGFQSSFRFYTDGGMLTKAIFGVLPRLNVGFGIDAEEFIGNQSTDLNRPTLNVKFRFFDGKRQLPALALGYDGQGYFFNESTDKYDQREKGLYLVGGGEILVPNLSLHGGFNVYDFTNDHAYGFVGVNYLFEERLSVSAEWDNIRKAKTSRMNIGGRFYVTPTFSVELAGRDLGAAGRKSERIIRLTYSGSF